MYTLAVFSLMLSISNTSAEGEYDRLLPHLKVGNIQEYTLKEMEKYSLNIGNTHHM